MTNNEDVNYIAECAKSVGIHIDAHTAISIPLIADVMRKMREQSNTDEDCISRKAAILEIQRHGVGCFDADEFSPEQAERFVINRIKKLSSIEPKAKVGYWIHYECSCCGGKAPMDRTWEMGGGYSVDYTCSNYCPHCGAKMEG